MTAIIWRATDFSKPRHERREDSLISNKPRLSVPWHGALRKPIALQFTQREILLHFKCWQLTDGVKVEWSAPSALCFPSRFYTVVGLAVVGMRVRGAVNKKKEKKSGTWPYASWWMAYVNDLQVCPEAGVGKSTCWRPGGKLCIYYLLFLYLSHQAKKRRGKYQREREREDLAVYFGQLSWTSETQEGWVTLSGGDCTLIFLGNYH